MHNIDITKTSEEGGLLDLLVTGHNMLEAALSHEVNADIVAKSKPTEDDDLKDDATVDAISKLPTITKNEAYIGFSVYSYFALLALNELIKRGFYNSAVPQAALEVGAPRAEFVQAVSPLLSKDEQATLSAIDETEFANIKTIMTGSPIGPLLVSYFEGKPLLADHARVLRMALAVETKLRTWFSSNEEKDIIATSYYWALSPVMFDFLVATFAHESALGTNLRVRKAHQSGFEDNWTPMQIMAYHPTDRKSDKNVIARLFGSEFKAEQKVIGCPGDAYKKVSPNPSDIRKSDAPSSITDTTPDDVQVCLMTLWLINHIRELADCWSFKRENGKYELLHREFKVTDTKLSRKDFRKKPFNVLKPSEFPSVMNPIVDLSLVTLWTINVGPRRTPPYENWNNRKPEELTAMMMTRGLSLWAVALLRLRKGLDPSKI